MTEFTIAIGANQASLLGTPAETLEKALSLLEEYQFEVVSVARWRLAPAIPLGSGPVFVNGAALLRGPFTPEQALSKLHEVEAALGRHRLERWGPRVCDLDLIACGDIVTPDEATVRGLMALGLAAQEAPAPDRLILPHPRMHERSFVLAPLADIAPHWRHPILGRTVLEMLADQPAEEREAVTLS